jgi:Spy/CpxP family protein refolding chaperone
VGGRSTRPAIDELSSHKSLNALDNAAIRAFTMIKITITALVAAAMFAGSSAFAGDHACCAKGAANPHSIACMNLASLNLTPDQKTKIEAWQTECMKAGCTKESRQTFLNRAKEILSPEQFAQLKAQCKKTANAKKSEA